MVYLFNLLYYIYKINSSLIYKKYKINKRYFNNTFTIRKISI